MRRDMISHLVVRIVAKVLLPYILLFALYVQFHGDFGPGGGFQAGVIFAAGVILYTMVFGLRAGERAFPPRVLEVLIAGGVLLYGGTGLVCMGKGGRYLEYGVLLHDTAHGQHLGILLVELGVGLTVAAAMISIFSAFVRRSRAE
jgi:multicomponent Na+:H+ antiporter subunit B